jgi:hypothetical protein
MKKYSRSKLSDLILDEAGVPRGAERTKALRCEDFREQYASDITDAMLRVFLHKGRKYGTPRDHKEGGLPPDYGLKILFADLSRKFQRFKFSIWTRKTPPTPQELVENLGDLAVYCVVTLVYLEEELARVDTAKKKR